MCLCCKNTFTGERSSSYISMPEDSPLHPPATASKIRGQIRGRSSSYIYITEDSPSQPPAATEARGQLRRRSSSYVPDGHASSFSASNLVAQDNLSVLTSGPKGQLERQRPRSGCEDSRRSALTASDMRGEAGERSFSYIYVPVKSGHKVGPEAAKTTLRGRMQVARGKCFFILDYFW